MSELTPEQVKHHIKTYVLVFVSLAFLTIVTVGISYLEVSVGMGITLALIVASVKGSLVACYFMHLIDEKVTIYWTLIATVVAFLILIFVPLSAILDHTKI